MTGKNYQMGQKFDEREFNKAINYCKSGTKIAYFSVIFCHPAT